MSDFITFTDENERYLKRMGVQATDIITAADLRAATERALEPGVMALQAQTLRVGIKTGRLRKAPGVKIMHRGRAPFVSVLGMVGFRSGIAPHDWYVEYGTQWRRTRGGAVRGQMSPHFLAERAFNASRDAISSRMADEMARLAQNAVRRLAAG